MKLRVIIILFIVFLLLGVVLAFFFSAKNSTSTKTSQTVATIGTAPRSIPSLPPTAITNAPKTVSFSLFVTPSPIQQTFPVYSVRTQNFDLQKQFIAKNLGFTSSPTTPPESSNALFWSENGEHITIYSSPPSISYYEDVPSTIRAPSRDEAIKTAQTFFSKINISMNSFTLAPDVVTFVAISGSSYLPVDDQSSANMATLSLVYSVGGHRLYSSTGLPIGNDFQVHAGGIIRSAAIVPPPIIVASQQKDVIQPKDAMDALVNNEGVLAAVVPTSPSEMSISNISINTVAITEYSLGYMYLDSQRVVRPIYIFTGKVVQGNDQTQGASVMYFVPTTYD